MKYTLIILLGLAYILIWLDTMDWLRELYLTPFHVKNWKLVNFSDIWLWINELAIIIVAIIITIKFIQKWS